MNEVINIELNKKDLKTILESLLYSCSLDVNSKWDLNDCQEAYELASFLRRKYPKVLTDKIYVFKKMKYHDQISNKIVDLFPESQENISYL
jgi:hypothetical protein